jgi:hypothetical protein
MSCIRQSQQVSENAGKHPKSGFLLRLRNAFYNFKESPKAILASNTRSANLITHANTIASQPAQLRIHPGSIMSHNASQPVSQSIDTIYNATRYALAVPVHYIQHHAAHAHGMA